MNVFTAGTLIDFSSACCRVMIPEYYPS